MDELLLNIVSITKAMELKTDIISSLEQCCERKVNKKKLLEALLSNVLTLCHCRSGAILLRDRSGENLVFEIVRGTRSRKLIGKSIPCSQGIVGWVFTHSKAVWVSHPQEDTRFYPHISEQINVPSRSIICAPIKCGDTVLGVIEIIHVKPGVDFSAIQFQILQSFCREAGYILRRSEQVQLQKEQVERFNTLTKISKAINSEKKLSRLLTLIADSATKLLYSEAGSIVLKDEKTGELVFEATDKKHMQVLKMRLASGTGIIGQVINSGEKLIIEDFQKDERAYKKVDKKTGFTTHSALCVPIKSGKKVVGALEVLNRIIPEPFSLDDLKVFEALADLSSIALQNAKLYESLQEKVITLEKKNIELQNTQAKLLQSEKLATVGEIAAGISHEIRNLITPIKLIVEDPPTPDEIDASIIAQQFQIINEQVDKATEMTSGMLSFSRKSSEVKEDLSVNAIIIKCVGLIGYRFKKSGIKLSTHLCKNIPQVVGVSSQLEQVIINLINNAENAICGEGSIQIRTRVYNHTIIIRIKDTGSGIKPEDLDKIWEPFFTTKDEKVGTGLGLPICANIISKHGGIVKVSSSFGTGTCVTIMLPCKCMPHN